MVVRVLIADHDQESRSNMREMVGSLEGCEVIGLARDGQETIQMTMQLYPHVAIISQDLPGISALQTCEIISALSPDVMLILVVPSKSPEELEKAMRAGVRAVVSTPINAGRLGSLIQELSDIRDRREAPEVTDWRDPSKFPKIISVTGAKGGVGKSTIAVNLAVVLGKQLPNKVALVDLYTQFGDVAAMLSLTPKRTISELEGVPGEFDAELISDYIAKHKSGVDVLVTAIDPVPLNAVSAACLDNLLYVLKRTYRYVILDVPPILHETTLHALAHSDVVLLIANLFDVTTTMDTKKHFDALLGEHVSKENIRLVLNRVLKANRLRVTDIQRLFDCSIAGQIPNDRRLVTAVNQGIPLTMNDGDSPLGRSFLMLAESITSPPRLTSKPTNLRRNGKAL